MKKIFSAVCVALALAGGVATVSHASSMSKPPHKMMKYMICPYCHMKMYTVKSAGAPIPVKIKGVTYYCCAACLMGKHHMKHM